MAEQAIRAHMAFLADDLLEGREPGTKGYDIAAHYVATQFALLGLKPAVAGSSYLQPVSLVNYRTAGVPTLTLETAGGATTNLVAGEDFGFGGWPTRTSVDLTAPLVFGGYGIVAHESGRDDFAGLDLTGKIVIVLDGAPEGLPPDERAHHASSTVKRMEASKRGAAGLIVIVSLTQDGPPPTPGAAAPPAPWNITWKAPDGRPRFRGGAVVPIGRVDRSGAAKLLAGGRMSIADIRAAMNSGDGRMPGFDLPARATVSLRTEMQDLASRNVVGLVEGSDPRLRSEYVIVTAHLDHLGVRPGREDSIFNGALDNASGVAILLELARELKTGPHRPRRSVLLVAVTAEERGLVGSDYFANHPPVPQGSMVANVNLDMPIITYDFSDVVALGAERSTLGAVVAEAARHLGVAVVPDPEPEQGNFTRSDHYRFVEQGIPAVFLRTGPGNGGAAASKSFDQSCYHRACDDLSQRVDYAAAAKFARLHHEIVLGIANAPSRPRWHAGDFFGRLREVPAR